MAREDDSIYGTSPYGTNPMAGIQGAQKTALGAAVSRVAGATGGTGGPVAMAGGSMGSFPAGTGDTGHGTAKNPIIYLGAGARIGFVGQDEATQMYYTWDAKTKNKFLSQLGLAGYDVGNLKDAQLASLWAGYVDVAGKYSQAGKWVSPWEVIGKDIAQREEAAAKPRTVTQTAKT